jgi:hypothetical protein
MVPEPRGLETTGRGASVTRYVKISSIINYLTTAIQTKQSQHPAETRLRYPFSIRRGLAMNNHSLISASRNTHAKIALLAVAVSVVFMAVVSASSITRQDSGARVHGPVVKATTLTNVAKSDGALVR